MSRDRWPELLRKVVQNDDRQPVERDTLYRRVKRNGVHRELE